jgi:ABC-2 type transport system permease protein
MKTHRIKAVVIRHAYEIRRNVDRVTDMLYWPVLDIIVWGFFTVYLARGQRAGGAITSFLLGAAILWGMFYAFQRDMAVGFLDELWSRNLINLFSTPLGVSEYLCGLGRREPGQGGGRSGLRGADRVGMLCLQHLSALAPVRALHT